MGWDRIKNSNEVDDYMAGSNGFKLSMAEFKGKVITSLDNIEKQFEQNREQHKLFFERIRKIEQRPSLSVNPIAWLLALFGIK